MALLVPAEAQASLQIAPAGGARVEPERTTMDDLLTYMKQRGLEAWHPHFVKHLGIKSTTQLRAMTGIDLGYVFRRMPAVANIQKTIDHVLAAIRRTDGSPNGPISNCLSSGENVRLITSSSCPATLLHFYRPAGMEPVLHHFYQFTLKSFRAHRAERQREVEMGGAAYRARQQEEARRATEFCMVEYYSAVAIEPILRLEFSHAGKVFTAMPDEFRAQREEMIEELADLEKHCKLDYTIIQHFVPSEVVESVKHRATWDEQLGEGGNWVLAPLIFPAAEGGAPLAPRPKSAWGDTLPRPLCEYAQFAASTSEYNNPRFRHDNILTLELDPPERTVRCTWIGVTGIRPTIP
eukprot:COSAG05_NODE_223_length_13640_cov_1551.628979_3_plen_351_part_00